MPKIITRYFESADKAAATVSELTNYQRFSRKIVFLYDQADGLVDALEAQSVETKTAKAYEKLVKKSGAVLLVRAGHKPLCVGQTTREVTAAMGAADMGDLVEEVYVAEEDAASSTSILEDHPLILSTRIGENGSTHYMADWPIPLLSRRKPFAEMLIEPHGRMASWPVPLLSKRKPSDRFAIPRHGRMAAFPIPLISRRKPSDKFAIPRHGRMAAFPIPLLSNRKPFTGSMISRHGRMADWPIALLMNGTVRKTKTLYAAGTRMANFPIPLLSSRKPYTGSAIKPHGRMAAFPFGLISKRKPFTGSLFPKHARMADFILPLTIRKQDKSDEAGKGFQLSRLLGLPTLIER